MDRGAPQPQGGGRVIESVAGPAIARLLADVERLFAHADELMGVTVPRVTLDLPAADPEPNHVFVWGTARDFGVAGALSNFSVTVTWHVWLTCVATGTTAEDAAATANAYQAIALQVPLVDITLGGTVGEIGAPQVKESESWADADGRRHAGYLLDFEMSKTIFPSDEARALIEEQ